MAVQFFFKEPEKDNIGELLSSGYKAGMEARTGQIKKDLDATYNQHVVTEPQYDAAGNVIARPGDLDHAGFIKSAQEAGLPMEESMKYLAHAKTLRDAQLDQAQTDNMIRASGEDPSPSVTGRAGAPTSDPNDPNKNYATFIEQQKQARDFANGGAGATTATGATGNGSDSNGSLVSKVEPEKKAPDTPEKPLTADDVWEHIKANKKDTGFIKQFQNEVGTKADGVLGKNTRAALDAWFKAQQSVPDEVGQPAPQVSADGTQMDLGSGSIHGSLHEKPVEEAKLQAPEDWNGGYVPSARVPDTRTAGQAVQDTYNPEATGAAGTGAVKPSDIFDYAKVTNVGDVKIKLGIDAALAKLGQEQSQAGVDRLMAIAAQSVPVPQLTGRTGEAYSKYLEARQAYPAKVLEAQRKVASDLAAGNTGAIAEQMGREQLGLSKEQYALAVRQNKRAESQVSHPAINGFLPTPAEKVALTDASGAVREMQTVIKKAPSPTSPEWGAFKLILAKSLIKAMSLPVGEGMVDEVASNINNGFDPTKTLESHGLSDAVAKTVSQTVSTAMGLNSLAGANMLIEGGTNFARKKWGAYGEGKDFDIYFPEYKAPPSKNPPDPNTGDKKPEKGDKTKPKLGSISNPYPVGTTPPIGSYYIHPKTGKILKRVK